MVFKPKNMSQPFHKTDAKQHTQQKKVNDYKKTRRRAKQKFLRINPYLGLH